MRFAIGHFYSKWTTIFKTSKLTKMMHNTHIIQFNDMDCPVLCIRHVRKIPGFVCFFKKKLWNVLKKKVDFFKKFPVRKKVDFFKITSFSKKSTFDTKFRVFSKIPHVSKIPRSKKSRLFQNYVFFKKSRLLTGF